MGQLTEIDIRFDSTLLEFFFNMQEMQESYNLNRLNSIILLKALLEKKDSLFYECLCATSVTNPYKQIISDCHEQLRKMPRKESKISLEEKPFKIQVAGKEQSYLFYFSEDFRAVLEKAYAIVIEEERQEENEEVIILYPEDLFIAFIEDTPKEALPILKNNGVYIEAIKNYYDLLGEIYDAEYAECVQEQEEAEKLPMAISDFATVLTVKYKGVEDCEILGRDKECSKVMRILQKRGKKNAVLIGEPGVGKTAIAEKIAYDIANGNCPEALKDHIVIQVDVNNSIAGTMYRGMAEARFKVLVDYLNTHDNVIVFIDEIHMVIGAGATSGNDSGNMANALKPFLASKKAKVIGATTQAEFEQHFSRDEAFKRRFEKVFVKEPKAKEVYPMLKKSIEAHEKFHGVKIEQEMVEYAILISSCFNKNTHNPDRTNDLIDCAMVIAKEKGKEYVDRECILENFDINFDKFHHMSKEEKTATAYHEAGHYLVWKKSTNLKDRKAIAVSIMPAEGYLGITVFDDLRDEVTVSTDKNYYIDVIAMDIAGRVAETLYTSNISAGAANDLENANKIAYQLVTELGMSKRYGNRTYWEDTQFHMMSEKIRNNIDREVKEIVEKATERAKEIICDNAELLHKLVEALLEKGILDENDLEKVEEDL